MQFVTWYLSLILAVFAPGVLVAQQTETPSGGQRPGIALVKPQAWSPDSQITIFEFESYIDRTVKTSPGAGYFEFRTAKNPGRQIPASKVVKLIVFPDAPQELLLPAQRAELQKQIDEFAKLSKQIPSARLAIQPSLEMLTGEAGKFDGGNVKVEGAWVPRPTYYKEKAVALVELLRPEIEAAPKARDFDLGMNQYFLGLEDLAVVEPSIKTYVLSMRSLHEAAKLKEERAEVLAKLKEPGMNLQTSEVLIERLKKLQPAGDPGAFAFLQSWDKAMAAAGNVRQKIGEAQTAFEAGIMADGDAVPVIPDAVASQVREASASLRAFRADAPPAVIVVPGDVADAMSAFIEQLPVVGKQIAAKNLFEAKAALDPLVGTASEIGPKTVAAIAGVQRALTTEVDRFRMLRDEGKMLVEADKIEDAIKKYEEALAIIPERDIAAQIESLKKQ